MTIQGPNRNAVTWCDTQKTFKPLKTSLQIPQVQPQLRRPLQSFGQRHEGNTQQTATILIPDCSANYIWVLTLNPLLDGKPSHPSGHRSTSAVPDRAGHCKPARICNDFLFQRLGAVDFPLLPYWCWKVGQKGDQRIHIAIEIIPDLFTWYRIFTDLLSNCRPTCPTSLQTRNMEPQRNAQCPSIFCAWAPFGLNPGLSDSLEGFTRGIVLLLLGLCAFRDQDRDPNHCNHQVSQVQQPNHDPCQCNSPIENQPPGHHHHPPPSAHLLVWLVWVILQRQLLVGFGQVAVGGIAVNAKNLSISKPSLSHQSVWTIN